MATGNDGPWISICLICMLCINAYFSGELQYTVFEHHVLKHRSHDRREASL